MRRMMFAAIVAVAAQGLAAAPKRPVLPMFAYVTASGSALVEVHDLQQIGFPFITSIATGATPMGVVVAPATGRVYVANNGSNSITVIDTATMSAVSTIDLTLAAPTPLQAPSDLVLSPDQQWLWVAAREIGGPVQGAVAKISTATNTVVEEVLVLGSTGAALDLALNTTGQQVYAVCQITGQVMQVRYAGGFASPSTGSTVQALTSAEWVDVTPDGTRVWVQDNNGLTSGAPQVAATNDWSVLAPTFAPVSGVPPGGASMEIYREIRLASMTSPGMVAYLADDWPTGKTVRVIDASTENSIGSVAPPVPGGFNPRTISIDPTDTLLFLGPGPGTTQSQMEVYDITSPTAPVSIGTLFTFTLPYRVAFGPPNPTPVLVDACPRGGPLAGGGTAILRGSGFTTGSSVQMNGVIAGGVNVISANEIRCVIPPSGGALRADIQLTAPDTQVSYLSTYYTYTSNVVMKNVAALPGTTVADYRLVSVPAIVDAPAFGAALEAAFGPYDPSVWRLFGWNRLQQRYEEFPEIMANAECDAVGRGLWLISRFGGTASPSGFDSEATFFGFRVPLAPGWNLVANPLDNLSPFPANCAEWDLLGSVPVQITDLSSWVNAAETNPVFNPFGNGLLYEWNGTSYVTTNCLEPGKGYWVFNTYSKVVYLDFNSSGSKPGEPVTKSTSPLAPGALEPPGPPGSAIGSVDDKGPAQCSFGARSGAAMAPLVVAVSILVLLRFLRRTA